MKNTLLVIAVILLSTTSMKAQQVKKVSLEKSIYGIQTGLFGIWGYNETKLSNILSLRSELGLNLGLWGGMRYPKTGYALFPTITVEPRYYYNLKRRVKLGKKTINNTGNFFSLKTSYNPNSFTISNYNTTINNHATIIPKWGLRRTFAKHFEYEFSTGIGYAYDFDIKKSAGLVLDLGFRIGYRF